MPDHAYIYEHQAEQYNRLIARQEDAHLWSKINDICPLKNADVVDLGAGAGRLTCQLAPHVKSVVATDAYAAMLKVTEKRLKANGATNVHMKVADHRHLPLEDSSADLVVSGWSICYLGSSNTADWQQNVRRTLAEVRRILRPGGAVIIFETMGTGTKTPDPPAFLKGYYDMLTYEYGFVREMMRLDYRFESVEEAEQLTRFFFGDELADRVAREQLVHVPECAGMWWRTFGS
jgi:ubiquinone/menaquinone biosynthesis C-methylase UbiE